MSTVTKLVLGAMGKLRPEPAKGAGPGLLALPPPQNSRGAGLMQALADRQSARDFCPRPLTLPLLPDLLWAAFGVNRLLPHCPFVPERPGGRGLRRAADGRLPRVRRKARGLRPCRRRRHRA
jgi:hypothetical protein